MILLAAEKRNANINHHIMGRFRQFIADEELRDLYMHDRRYTGSNERDNPTLVRNDRILYTSGWETAHPHCLLQCLSSAASDHCPLLVDCVARPPGARRFHFERFWPKLQGFHDMVSKAWTSSAPDADPFRRIVIRPKATARQLQRWSARTIGNVSLQLKVARELIAHLDTAQDSRPLSLLETWLRRKLKASYLGLPSLERSIAGQ
ncbi:hypothetical protein D1007_48867 [Hordeum vulgare]|nr:hypothetical protein D1007_48867 [Hordeum vulgare]